MCSEAKPQKGRAAQQDELLTALQALGEYMRSTRRCVGKVFGKFGGWLNSRSERNMPEITVNGSDSGCARRADLRCHVWRTSL